MPHNVKKRKSPNDQPVFLKKTWTLVNRCPPDIACWGENGLSFIVLNQTRFAEEIIPQYFKHNNFSSFVRQLNLYGFHKIKSETLLMKDEEQRLLEFKHPHFQRDHPELMSEIKRAANGSDEFPSFEEFQSLKNQVADLTAKINYMSRVVGALTYVDWSSREFSLSAPGQDLGGIPPPIISRSSDRNVESMEDIVDTLMQLEGCDYLSSSSSEDVLASHQHHLPQQEAFGVRGAPYSHQFLKRFNYALASSNPRSCGSTDPEVCTDGGDRSTARLLNAPDQGKLNPTSQLGFSMKAVGQACAQYANDKPDVFTQLQSSEPKS